VGDRKPGEIDGWYGTDELQNSEPQNGRFRGHGMLWWLAVVLIAAFLTMAMGSCVAAIMLYG
jgi:hypothetical protein